MSNEITQTGSLGIVKGFFKLTRTVSSQKVTQTGDGMVSGVQNISSAHEPIDMGDIVTAGMCFFRNINAAGGDDVDIGTGSSAAFTAFITLKPGEFFIGRLATSTPYAQASSSGGVELEYYIYED